jgi:hypothetical protein
MTDTTAADDDAARQAELEKQREMERQKQLEEERLAAERAEQLKADAMERDVMMAKNRFLNENVYFDFDNAALDYQAQSLLKQKPCGCGTTPMPMSSSKDIAMSGAPMPTTWPWVNAAPKVRKCFS